MKDSACKKKEAEKLRFETWPNFRSFWIWRMNFRSEVSSGASRLQARIWICEIESAKSIAEL